MSEINALGTPCFSGSCTEIYHEKCFQSFPNTYQKTLPNAADMGARALLFLIDPSINSEKITATISAIQRVAEQASL